MKCHEVELKLPKGENEAKIGVICCLHIGARNHDRERAISWRDWILSKPNHFAFSLGDDTENALPGDEEHNSMMFDQILQPQDQFIGACEYWKPIVLRRQLVLNHDSNHFWRTEAKTGRSMAKEMNVFLQGLDPKGARRERAFEPQADLYPRWARWQALTHVRVGSQLYRFHSWHGVGSGCTPEAALRKCRSMVTWHPADIYCMGHAHQKINWSDDGTVFTSNGEDAALRERHYVCTGGFLKWNDSYGERKGLPPNRIGGMVVTLRKDRWDIKVSS